MTDRGIIFSAPMVRALMAERKTQTRRLLKPQPPGDCAIACIASNGAGWAAFDGMGNGFALSVAYAPGDRLWVKEVFGWASRVGTVYRADGDRHEAIENGELRWRSPIFMPRWASRLTLTVTDVRVQRVQEISEADALAEGMHQSDGAPGPMGPTQMIVEARNEFRHLWDDLHGPCAWDANPWVCALTFTVQNGNIGAVSE